MTGIIGLCKKIFLNTKENYQNLTGHLTWNSGKPNPQSSVSRLPGNSFNTPGKSKATMSANSDFSDLLRLFNVNNVKYLIIGGYTLIQYAEPRYTKNLDIWISADKENAAAPQITSSGAQP